MKNTIAVLPFINMSPNPENEYMSDGITEEMLQAQGKRAKLIQELMQSPDEASS